MSTTTIEDAAPGSWNEVVTSKAWASLQLQSEGVVLVHVGQSAPANDSTVGLLLEKGAVEEISFSGLETGDSIYIRSLTDDTDPVAVVQPGATV